MTYHDTIIDLLYYILSQDERYLENIDSGNAYDKIIRNYHQFNSEGKKVYKNLRARKYLKFSKSAFKKSKKKWYFEHLVPVSLTKKNLKDLMGSDKLTKENIKEILNSKNNEIVVITKDEQKLVDKKFRVDLPENNINRLQAVGIELAEETIQNTIFN